MTDVPLNFKHRPSGFGKRRVQSRATAPKLTTEVRPVKTVSYNQRKVALRRIEPSFTEPEATCSLMAKDLYGYRQRGAVKNWEDTVFVKKFTIIFHNSMEFLPIPEKGYAICLMDLVARHYQEFSSYGMFLGMELRHKDMNVPICLPYLPIHKLNDTVILDQLLFLRNQCRFPKEIEFSEFELDLCFVRQLLGSGIKPGAKIHLEKQFKGVTPNNVTRYCLPIAIMQGICFLEYDRDKNNTKKEAEWKELMSINDENADFKKIIEKVEDLVRTAGLVSDDELKQENYTIDDVRALQTFYAHQYQIVVFAEANNKKPVFVGPTLLGKNIIPLVCKDGHYQHINSLHKFTEKRYYCVDCKVGYSTLMQHYNCPLRCRLCNLYGCESDGSEIVCINCKVTFFSKQCEENHKKPLESGSTATVCGMTLYCEKCDTPYRKNKGHECYTNYCTHCQVARPKGHSCIMSHKKSAHRAVQQKLIFVQVKYEEVENDDGTITQKPILAMALKCCKDCREDIHLSLNKGLNSSCKKCSKDSNRFWFRSRFQGEDIDILTELITFLFTKSHEKYCVIFHRIPDCVNEYLLNYVTTDGTLKSKRLSFTEGSWNTLFFEGINLRIIDTFSLYSLPLWKLAKYSGISLPYKKFPQRLLYSNNLKYVGMVPKVELFLEEAVGDEEKDLVRSYHNNLQQHPYIVLNEILNVTYHEIILLALSVWSIDSSSFDLLGVRLVEETSDLLSAGLLSYRRSFYTDGILTLDVGISFRFNNTSSMQAMEYLAWRSHVEQTPIDSSMNVGEYRLPGTPYYSDGFIHPCEKYPRGLAIEIHGCYWHAHGCCYVPKIVARRELNVEKIRRQDTTKKAVFEKFHDFETVWECEVAALRTSPEIVDFLNKFVYEGPVDLYASLYPPRIETFYHYSESNDNVEIRICDISNLPGRVLKEGEFPVCELRRIHGELFKTPIHTAQELRDQVKGVVYCQVLAPSSLSLPVLPDSINENISYHLCKGCLENSLDVCEHSEEEQIFTGTWTTFDLELALEHGYVITRIIGAIHWDKWSKYEQVDGKENHSIFSKYADILLEMEELSRAESQPNEILERTATTFMRVGDKMAQRSDTPTTRIIGSKTELWRLLEDPTMLVREIKTGNKDKLVVSAGNKRFVVDSTGERKIVAKPIDTTVSIVPSLLGGQQRAKIYRAITQDGCEPIYIDGNCIVFRCERGSNPLGSLGPDLFPGVRISKFWSNGSGRFAIQTEGGELYMKSPGFERKGESFIARATAIKEQTEKLLKGQSECVEIKYLAVSANSQHILKTRNSRNLIHLSSPYSRRVQEDGSTLPIGFLW